MCIAGSGRCASNLQKRHAGHRLSGSGWLATPCQLLLRPQSPACNLPPSWLRRKLGDNPLARLQKHAHANATAPPLTQQPPKIVQLHSHGALSHVVLAAVAVDARRRQI